jgi:hypothetical protein
MNDDADDLFLHLATFSTLKRGQQRLFLHPQVKADPSVQSTTPSDAHQDDEMARLERVCSISISQKLSHLPLS